MGNRPSARTTLAVRLLLADLLTLGRTAVAIALVVSGPAPATAMLLVAFAWASDAADGRLARSAGSTGRLAALDRPADAALAVGLIWYLGALGVVPALATRAGALALVVVWATTRVLAVQMLLVAAASASLLTWAVVTRPAGWWLPPVTVVVVLGLDWQRFRDEMLPGFLRGWAALLTGRYERPQRPPRSLRRST